MSTVFPVKSLQYHGNNYFSQLTGYTWAKAAQQEVHLYCCQGALLTPVQFAITKGLKLFSAELPFCQSHTRVTAQDYSILGKDFASAIELENSSGKQFLLLVEPCVRVSAMTSSELMPHPNLALGMSFLLVLISQGGDEYHSGHVKCCQPQYHQFISVRLPYMSNKYEI